MKKDKIVEQVRKNRERLFAQFDYDIKKFSEYLLESQTKGKRKIITLKEMKSKDKSK
ncbi:MAG: hypothetical protein V1779_07770 [bacterium]